MNTAGLFVVGRHTRRNAGDRYRRSAAGLRLQKDEAAWLQGTLYVDCTAIALAARKPTVLIFDAKRITLPMARFPQSPFSAAFVAFLEATIPDDDVHKNRLVAPMQLPDTVDGYIRLQEIEFGNRLECAREPSVRAWTDASRLEVFAALARAVTPDGAPRKAILQRLNLVQSPG
jgi:hypothetical protein